MADLAAKAAAPFSLASFRDYSSVRAAAIELLDAGWGDAYTWLLEEGVSARPLLLPVAVVLLVVVVAAVVVGGGAGGSRWTKHTRAAPRYTLLLLC